MSTPAIATRRRDSNADAWLVAFGAVAATYAIAQLAPTAVDGNPRVEVVTQVLLALAVGAGAFVVARRFPPSVAGALVALLTGLFLCGGAAVLLNATAFGPLGAVADQGYRTAYLTKFGHGWGLVDYAYKDLPSFYPPLYFWVLGRLSALLGIAPWQMLKIGTLAVAFLVPTGGWLLWRPIVGPRRAAVVVVVTSIAFQEWYVPHLWLAIAVFVPWWLSFVLGVGRAPGRRLGRGGVAVGIVLGAVVALTYWYVLLIGLVQLVGLLAARRIFRHHRRTPEPPSRRDAALVLGGVAVVTIPYWLPLAVSILTTPGAQPMQNRYFTPDEVSLPFPFLTFDLQGAVLLAGLVSLVATAHRRRVSMHLLGLLGAAYVLYLVGYLGFLVDNPLDTLRTQGLIEFLLAAGAALGAADLWRAATTWQLPTRVDPRAARAVVAVGAVVLVFAFGQHAVRDVPYLEQQRGAQYPTRLIDRFERATGGKYEDAVVLTDVTDLSSFLPTYVFNTSNAHYSHPAALFNDRADLLTRLAGESDPEVFELAFLHNRYDAIDLVALHGGTGGLTYSWLADAFPEGVAQRSLTFPVSSFAGDAFVPLDGSELTLYRVDRGKDPLRTLRSCPARPAQARCDVLDPLLARYSQHLDVQARDLATRWRERR
ncbi:MAG: arabinofuranosyltransferase [Acidimicrobiia bacterium]|jgi:galactan 5-O-arabinofuranosyltransferase